MFYAQSTSVVISGRRCTQTKTETAQSEEEYKLECSHAQEKRQGRSANCSPYRKLHQLVDLVPPQSIPEGEALELDDQGVGQPPHGHLLAGLPLLLAAGAVPANTTSRSGNSSRYVHRGMLFSRLNTCTLHLSLSQTSAYWPLTAPYSWGSTCEDYLTLREQIQASI